jgi:hypothetical protein
MAVNIEPFMWHVNIIQWQAAYDPQVKNACALNENKQLAELIKMELILKGDQKIWSLNITDKTSKDKFKKHATYP